jgi:membrane protein DedA with SNARE-associated domain
MHELLDFLLRHGYSVLALWVFAEQVGLPIPSLPLMLAAGALSGSGRMNLFACLLSSVFGALLADNLWYQLGRRRGIKVLQWLCRISLEPDSCVRRTEGIFERNGARSLIFAKFVPGLSAVTTPLAGIFHMRPRRFFLFDSLGALLWVGSYLGAGYLFSTEIERIAERASFLGGWLVVLLAAGFAAYIIIKFVARQKFLRGVRIARISPQELKEKLDAGEELFIVDLRHSLDFEAEPELIPGAVHVDSKELSEKSELWPHDREIILYCT